ncbi:MAG: ABC transporter permease [Nitrincola sp.]|nr:ABC transporter permease [Nitrincola sp.]
MMTSLFQVSGILRPTGTAIDRNLFISLAAWEAIHIDWRAGTRIPGMNVSADEAREMDLTPTQITAFLLGLESRISTFHLQRAINNFRAEPLQAILPGVALQELWQVMSIAERTLMIISGFVVFAGFTGMLGMLLTSLNERRRELAVLRAVGASPFRIVVLLVFEAVLLTFLGILLGLLLLALITLGVQDWLALEYGIFFKPTWLAQCNSVDVNWCGTTCRTFHWTHSRMACISLYSGRWFNTQTLIHPDV